MFILVKNIDVNYFNKFFVFIIWCSNLYNAHNPNTGVLGEKPRVAIIKEN